MLSYSTGQSLNLHVSKSSSCSRPCVSITIFGVFPTFLSSACYPECCLPPCSYLLPSQIRYLELLSCSGPLSFGWYENLPGHHHQRTWVDRRLWVLEMSEMLDARGFEPFQRSFNCLPLSEHPQFRPSITRLSVPTDWTLGCSLLSQEHKVSIGKAQKQIPGRNIDVVVSVSKDHQGYHPR